jgi:hypothetical protein
MSDDPVKAFKAAFGVSSTSDDWDKMLAALNRKLPDLLSIVGKLQALQSPQAVAAQNAYDALNNSAQLARLNFRQNKATVGAAIRDTLLPQLLRDLNTYRKAEKATPLSVVPTGGGGAVNVYRNDIPGYDSMNAAARQAAAQAAADQIKRGKDLYGDVIAGRKNGAVAQPNEVVDLAWALKAAAQTKNGPYEKGAMTVPNGLSLRTFLDSCAAEIYPRKSSHLPDEQRGNGKSPRGMDFYNQNGPGKLPAGMNTLLFQMVDAPNGAKALYIKMETEGAYGSGNDNVNYDPTAPNPRPSYGWAADTTALIKHGWNYVKPRENSDPDIAPTREDAPKQFQELVNTILKKMTQKQARACLKAAIGKSMRINAVYAALDKIARADLLDGVEVSDLQALDDFVTTRYGAQSKSDIERRFGDEVLLEPNDI